MRDFEITRNLSNNWEVSTTLVSDMGKHKPLYVVSWEEITSIIKILAKNLSEFGIRSVTGIPRGGLIPAIMLSHEMGIPYIDLDRACKKDSSVKTHTALVDDISDSGHTLLPYLKHQFPVVTLLTRSTTEVIPTYTGQVIDNSDWVIFPWERKEAPKVQDYLASNL